MHNIRSPLRKYRLEISDWVNLILLFNCAYHTYIHRYIRVQKKTWITWSRSVSFLLFFLMLLYIRTTRATSFTKFWFHFLVFSFLHLHFHPLLLLTRYKCNTCASPHFCFKYEKKEFEFSVHSALSFFFYLQCNYRTLPFSSSFFTIVRFNDYF